MHNFDTVKDYFAHYMTQLTDTGRMVVVDTNDHNSKAVYNFFKDVLALWTVTGQEIIFAEEKLVPPTGEKMPELIPDNLPKEKPTQLSETQPKIERKTNWYTLLVAAPLAYIASSYGNVKNWIVQYKNSILVVLGLSVGAGGLWYLHQKSSPSSNLALHKFFKSSVAPATAATSIQQ